MKRWIKNRKKAFYNKISKTLSLHQFTVYRKPVMVVLLEFAFVSLLFLWLYTLYPLLGDLLRKVYSFFQLELVFKLKLVEDHEFILVAQWIAAGVLLYHWGVYFLEIIENLFSLLVVSRRQKTVAIIRVSLFKKKITLIPASVLSSVRIEQNPVQRFTREGDIFINNTSGESHEFHSAGKALQAQKEITGMIDR